MMVMIDWLYELFLWSCLVAGVWALATRYRQRRDK